MSQYWNTDTARGKNLNNKEIFFFTSESEMCVQ
jgi:hypothetical protein